VTSALALEVHCGIHGDVISHNRCPSCDRLVRRAVVGPAHDVSVEKVAFYKATRPDGTSFYDGVTKWQVGRIVRHPNPNLASGLCSAGVLHFSDAPGETLVGGSWPCRLFEVEPRGEMIGPDEHKYGTTALKVVAELSSYQALGPNGEEVAALIKRCKTLTPDEIKRLVAAWVAARDAAWVAAEDAARDAAWVAAWVAARDAARAAALALIVRDLITAEQFELLYGSWRMGGWSVVEDGHSEKESAR